MDIEATIQSALKAGRKILFSRDSGCLRSLMALIEASSHRALILWALDCADGVARSFEAEQPEDKRLRDALNLCAAWAHGEVKMPVAKRAILAAHAAAKEAGDPRLAALAHAVGQAGATVHVKTHAPGLVFYELTALALSEGPDRRAETVASKIDYYRDRLLYWRGRADEPGRIWAKFLAAEDA